MLGAGHHPARQGEPWVTGGRGHAEKQTATEWPPCTLSTAEMISSKSPAGFGVHAGENTETWRSAVTCSVSRSRQAAQRDVDQLRCQKSVLFRDGGREGTRIGGGQRGAGQGEGWEEEVPEGRWGQEREPSPGTGGAAGQRAGGFPAAALTDATSLANSIRTINLFSRRYGGQTSEMSLK